jgi:hypothetical protein
MLWAKRKAKEFSGSLKNHLTIKKERYKIVQEGQFERKFLLRCAKKVAAMPGFRFRHRIILGPLTGQDCRLLGQDPRFPGTLHLQLRDGTKLHLPLEWVQLHLNERLDKPQQIGKHPSRRKVNLRA